VSADARVGEGLRSRALWLALLPPLVFMAVRWGLRVDDGAAAAEPLWPLEPAPVVASVADVWAYFAPWLLTPVGLIALAWIAKRRGWLARGLAGIWVVLWLGGAAAMAAREFNRAQLEPVPAVQAELLAARPVAPSTRSAGGVDWYLRLAGESRPYRMRVDDPAAAGVPVGAQLSLQRVRGRWWGVFVRGYTVERLPLPGPAAAAGLP
jgi:hypothetical protein